MKYTDVEKSPGLMAIRTALQASFPGADFWFLNDVQNDMHGFDIRIFEPRAYWRASLIVGMDLIILYETEPDYVVNWVVNEFQTEYKKYTTSQ